MPDSGDDGGQDEAARSATRRMTDDGTLVERPAARARPVAAPAASDSTVDDHDDADDADGGDDDDGRDVGDVDRADDHEDGFDIHAAATRTSATNRSAKRSRDSRPKA